jgi:hypothetical protein
MNDAALSSWYSLAWRVHRQVSNGSSRYGGKKFVKGMPKTLFNVWGTQRLDSKARHGKSRRETFSKKGMAQFLLFPPIKIKNISLYRSANV